MGGGRGIVHLVEWGEGDILFISSGICASGGVLARLTCQPDAVAKAAPSQPRFRFPSRMAVATRLKRILGVNATAGHAFRPYGHASTLSPLAWER